MPITIQELWVYPIKSTKGIRLLEADVLLEGLIFDRRWMLVDTNGLFLTARKFPKMLQIETSIADGKLYVSAPRMETLSLSIAGDEAKAQEIDIWGRKCQGLQVSEQADKWFSDYMGFDCRLVRTSESHPRQMKPKHVLDGKGIVSFADAFPLLVISQASLDALNQRLASPVTMERFRPNIVVSGCSAFAEDHWAAFAVHDIPFWGGKLCDRCVLTTIDPVSGEKGKEPLKTLAEFRKWDQKVYFGLNAASLSEGLIREGDEIVVHEEK